MTWNSLGRGTHPVTAMRGTKAAVRVFDQIAAGVQPYEQNPKPKDSTVTWLHHHGLIDLAGSKLIERDEHGAIHRLVYRLSADSRVKWREWANTR